MNWRFNTSRGDVLFLQPLDSQWLDTRGNALPEPPAVGLSAHVVVDLMEETHVQVDVPSMMLNDRRGFVDFHLQSKLPDVLTRTTWPTGSLSSPLPKAFTLNAVGVASERLQTLLDQMAVDGRPLVGAWTLSYLMAHWANRRKEVPRRGAVFLCLTMKHGMRVVLLKDQVPVFSRLLMATDADALGEDLVQTLRYLVDSRVIDRDVTPSFVLLDATPGLYNALSTRALTVLPASERFGEGVLGQVLSLAKGAAPGQIATVFQRRLRLATQLKRIIVLLSALTGVGLAMTAYGEVQRILDQLIQANQWTAQSTALTHRVQQVRQKISESGADVALMRLTSEVRRTELPDPVQPDALLWQLGQLLQAHPKVNLANVAFSVSAAPCLGIPASAAMQTPRGAVTPGPTSMVKNQIEWKFQLNPINDLSPRARQELLGAVSRSVSNWSDWQVVNDPVRPAGTVALSSKQAGDANAWSWCLKSPSDLMPQSNAVAATVAPNLTPAGARRAP